MIPSEVTDRTNVTKWEGSGVWWADVRVSTQYPTETLWDSRWRIAAALVHAAWHCFVCHCRPRIFHCVARCDQPDGRTSVEMGRPSFQRYIYSLVCTLIWDTTVFYLCKCHLTALNDVKATEINVIDERRDKTQHTRYMKWRLQVAQAAIFSRSATRWTIFLLRSWTRSRSFNIFPFWSDTLIRLRQIS